MEVKGTGYIDIHSHMLPGVDDGSKDISQSMEMIGMAAADGTGTIVLTPHFETGRNHYEPKQLPEIFETLQAEVKEKYPQMQLYLGNEILYTDGIIEKLQNGEIQTLNNTKYVLVEFAFQISYKELYKGIRQLVDARYRPILAHVERFHCLTNQMGRILELEELGVYLQMNAESIPGKTFDATGKWCRKLLKEEMITFLGSDAHNTDTRHPSMKKAVEWMEKHLREQYVMQVLYEYPRIMLENGYPR